METVAKKKQGICLKGSYVSVTGIHAEDSTSKYWFAIEEGDADTISEQHLKLLCVQKPGQDGNSSDRLSISGPGLMSLPDSIARQALKNVLTKDCESEYSYLVIRDLKNTSTIADFFRIFVRDFGPSSAAVGSNSYCASGDVKGLEFRFQDVPKAWEALIVYLLNKDCWHFYQGIEYLDFKCLANLVPQDSVARMGSGIAEAMCGRTMRHLSFGRIFEIAGSSRSILSLFHNLILGTSETGAKIHDLRIHHNCLSDDVLAFLNSSAVFENLEWLCVYCDKTAEKSSEVLGKFLSKPHCRIQKLDVPFFNGECDLQRKGLLHVPHIFHGLSRNTSLKYLSLGFHDSGVVRDDIAIQVGRALRLNRTLERLDFYGFLTSKNGAAILADALVESCSPLVSLGVYSCSSRMIQHIEVWERCLQCNPYLGRVVPLPSCGPVGFVDPRLLSVLYLLCLNRAGRRFFFLPTSARSSKRRKISKHPTPRLALALWPLLIARVSKKDFVDPYSRALGICPADMIYRMLQDGPFFHEW